MGQRTQQTVLTVTVSSAVLLIVAAIIAASVTWPEFGLTVVLTGAFCFGFFGIISIFALIVVTMVKLEERKKTKKQESAPVVQEAPEKNHPDS
ncbi:hypothetical protein HZA87_05990 [Candidatus Uhrbacteria bacterium]|nr:hypothetical protein [Candidatus Uhrbacteria bacterium]